MLSKFEKLFWNVIIIVCMFLLGMFFFVVLSLSYTTLENWERLLYLSKNDVLFVCLMVSNATFNNISVISWRSVLLVEETGVPRENHRPVASH
jgi:hypothetical protein